MSDSDKKIFGKTLGLSGLPRPQIGQFPAGIGHKSTIEISKIRIWGYFRVILSNFFFQNLISLWNRPKIFQNGFWEFLWGLKMISNQFWIEFEKLKFWIFWNFSNVIPSFYPVLSQHVSWGGKLEIPPSIFLKFFSIIN